MKAHADQALPTKALRPGTTTPELRREEILRVDHAGELGAVRIYQGQLAVFRDRASTRRTAAIVEQMAQAEARHKASFDRMLAEHKTRPTAFHPLWSAAGYALGVATALLGEKAAMAATLAVEEVIDRHYEEQIAELKASDSELAAQLEVFRDEEIEHKEQALAEGAKSAPGYPLLSAVIKAGCRLAIRVAEKL